MPQLRIEPNQRIQLINAPTGFDGLQSVASEPFDVALLFVASRSELERNAPAAVAALKNGAKLWVAYPKPGSGPVADLTRDHGWGALHAAGLVGATPVTVNESWNALRWRPNDEAVAAGVASAEVPPVDLLPIGRRATFAYRVIRAITVPLLRLSFRFTVHGRENIPRSGTYIVIANHLGWLDAMTVLMVFPTEPRIHMLADPTGMMRRKAEWAFIRAAGGIIPVERSIKDPQALFRRVGDCLKLGGAVALFPEGDFGPREGELLPFKKGFAHFAVSGGVPVVPVGLSGMKDVWLGKRMVANIGPPIPSSGRTVDELHQLGAEAVTKLLPEYHEPPGPKPLRRWLTGLF
jgi:1-acyl-sn-glycerol-3-phosphate acyltransferase